MVADKLLGSGVAFQRFELKELSWSSGLSKLLQVQRCNPSSSPINANSKPPRTVTASYQTDGSTKYFDFALIGSGVAGLHYALEVAKHGTVAVITKAEPHESNTNYAQGGVSAVLCPSDSVEKDTIVAGAHLCDEETIRVFESLAVLLSELDVLLSFVDLAISCPTPYTRPDITTSVMIYKLFASFGLFQQY
ncbi:hypothetical protein ACSBR2_010543 [Camellia fascicularis]